MEAATVICYARPFTGRGKISGRFASIKSNPPLQTVHDELIKHRHSSIAHSDEELNLVVIAPPGKHVKSGTFTGTTKGFGDGVRSQAILLPIFPAIVQLCDFQIDRLNDEIEERKKELETVFSAAKLTEF